MIDLGNCFPEVSYRLVDMLHAKNMSDNLTLNKIEPPVTLSIH